MDIKQTLFKYESKLKTKLTEEQEQFISILDEDEAISFLYLQDREKELMMGEQINSFDQELLKKMGLGRRQQVEHHIRYKM